MFVEEWESDVTVDVENGNGEERRASL